MQAFTTTMSESLLNANKNMAEIKVPVGLQLHIINIYPEELAKVRGVQHLYRALSSIQCRQFL